jgi:Protein of unknown function (DUF4231)
MAQDQSSQSQFDILKAAVVKNIDTFRAKRDFNRSRAFRLRLAIVTIGVLTTIILGLKPYVGFQNSDAFLSAVALVLSALIPIFTTWEGFFEHRWLWIRYTLTLNSLYAIRDELEFSHAAGAINKMQLDSLFAQLQRTLEEIDGAWTERRNSAMTQQAGAQEKLS